MIKHQTESYRTIKGVRYVCWGDVMHAEGEAMIATCKRHRVPHRVVKMDGFKRLFVAETHTEQLC